MNKTMIENRLMHHDALLVSICNTGTAIIGFKVIYVINQRSKGSNNKASLNLTMGSVEKKRKREICCI
jgi:hypothetical protein